MNTTNNTQMHIQQHDPEEIKEERDQMYMEDQHDDLLDDDETDPTGLLSIISHKSNKANARPLNWNNHIT